MSRLLVTVAVVLVVCAVVTPTADAKKIRKRMVVGATDRDEQNKNPISTAEAEVEQIDKLPDFGDPEIFRQMRCSSCKVLTRDIYGQLMKYYKMRHGKIKTYEVLEFAEDICEDIRHGYGLLVDDNAKQTTTIFSKDRADHRFAGAAISSFVENRCNDIMENHEDTILKEFYKFKDLRAFQREVCEVQDKSCNEVEIDRGSY